MSVPELQVLKPIDPSITSPDDYEIFVLNNAQVVYESNGKLGNLLLAYADTPMRVEGSLEPLDRSQTQCLVKKPYKRTDLVVRNVMRYSYGERVDGQLVIWALGKAGWFELRPAPLYKEIYASMVQAVELLYFVSDIYNEEPRKRSSGPTAQLLFQEYCEDKRFSCTDLATAEQIFRKHHQFLIMSFLNQAQDLKWGNTSIYQYFKKQYPKVFEDLKSRREGRSREIPEQAKNIPAKTQVLPTRGTQKTRSTRSTPAPKSSGAPKKDDNWWEAAAIYEFMRSAVNVRVLRPGRRQITLDRVAALMIKRYEIDDVETARLVLLVHASNLRYKMEHPRSKEASFFTDEPIYHELPVDLDLPAAEIRKAQAVVLRPRRDYNTREQTLSEDSESDSPDAAVVTPQRRPDGRRKRGRLSVLRPKSGKFSGKSKSIGRDADQRMLDSEDPSSEEADSSAEGEAEAGDAIDSDMEIDTPTAVSPNREKRKFINLKEDAGEAGTRKRAASTSTTSSNNESTATTPSTSEVPLPLINHTNGKSNEKHSNSDLIAPIISTPLPTHASNGPRDSWFCTFDGCSQRIYGASKALGQELITEHLEDHANGRQDVVGIIWREKEKLSLPVNNLLRKIREISDAETPLFPSSLLSEAVQPQ